jgi:predicted nucleic acid-binding protein
MSTASRIRGPRHVRDPERHQRGLVDTSVVLDLGHIDAAALPEELAVSAISMAELAAGPHATDDLTERAPRQDRLQRAEASFDPVPFDDRAARSYGRVYAAVLAAGRKARGARAVDLLIAATALANRLPLFTRNPDDFKALEELIDIIDVPQLEAFTPNSPEGRK